MNYIPKAITPFSWSYTRILVLLLSGFFLLGTENAVASHLSGGHITYQCLGNNQYRVHLSLYRHCSGINMGTQQFINISSSSCAINIPNVSLTLDNFYEVSSCPSNTDCNGGALPGLERYIYSDIITLPQTCTDWVFSWSSCCRNFSVSNLATSQANLYMAAGVNSTYCNDSPVFTSERDNYLCAGHCYEYNSEAYDPDGDTMIYALTCALQAANTCTPNIAPLSPTQPIVTSPLNSLALDSNTGQMTFCTAPGQSQVAVVVTTVYQIVNGDTIGYVQKDMHIVVVNSVNCTAPVVGTSPIVLSGGTYDSLSRTFEVCVGEDLIFETIVHDPEGSTVGLNTFNTNMDLVFGAGNWSVVFDTIAPYRPDSARAVVQINTTTQHIGMNVFTLSLTDNTCPIRGINTRGFRVNVIGVNAAIATTGSTEGSYCPGIALDIPLEATINSNGSGTYIWTQLTGPVISFSSTTIPNPILSLPSTTQDGDTIKVSVTYTTGACVSTDEITIYTEISPINLEALASDTTLCPNGTADTIAFSILAGNSTVNTSDGVYTWTATPTSYLSNLINTATNTPAAILNTIASDTIRYMVRYDYGLCADSVEITLGTRAGLVIASTSLDTICLGDSTQLMAVLTDTVFILDTTACYNYSVDSIPFAPIAGSGTTVSLADDALSTALPIGFDFDFYCTTYTQFAISSNGFITFDVLGVANGCCSGQALPDNAAPNNLIALCWEDLSPNNGGTIDYFTTGTAPNRQLVVRFDNVPRFGGANTVTTQVVLHEGTNIIDIHSTSVTGAPFDITTQGIENEDGTFGLATPGRNASDWSATNDAYRFTPGSGYLFGPITYDWTPSNTVSNSTIYNPIASPLQTTTYEVSINEQGCVRTDSVEVVVNPVTTINAPVVSCGFATVPTNSVLFEWGQASGATAWEYSLDSGATWTTSLFSDSSFLYTGLLQGTCYGIWVRALAGVGGCINNAATYLDCCTSVLSNVVTQNGIILSAVAAGPSIAYQWIDCNNGNALIVGETGQSFTPTADGNYAVVISDGVNTVTSTCMNVNVSAITKLSKELGIVCYPNPTTGLVHIERKNAEMLEIQVIDPLGRVLFIRKTNDTVINLDLGAYSTGIYMIQFNGATKSVTQKIIKE